MRSTRRSTLCGARKPAREIEGFGFAVKTAGFGEPLFVFRAKNRSRPLEDIWSAGRPGLSKAFCYSVLGCVVQVCLPGAIVFCIMQVAKMMNAPVAEDRKQLPSAAVAGKGPELISRGHGNLVDIDKPPFDISGVAVFHGAIMFCFTIRIKSGRE